METPRSAEVGARRALIVGEITNPIGKIMKMGAGDGETIGLFNLDDHPRNHAVIAKDEHWKLSPAYDLTPAPVIGRDRRDLAMECGDLGRYANAKNLLSQHARFLLDKLDLEAILQDMTVKVGKWYDVVRACGVSERDAETIRAAFLYPGFSY